MADGDHAAAPMIGKRRWIVRKNWTIGGDKRKTKRRDQRIAREAMDAAATESARSLPPLEEEETGR